MQPSNQGCDWHLYINTLRLRQNGCHFADDTFKCMFVNENVWTLIKISLMFVSKGPVSNIPALVQMMAWHQPGDKPSSEPMMVRLPAHICITRPQWVSYIILKICLGKKSHFLFGHCSKWYFYQWFLHWCWISHLISNTHTAVMLLLLAFIIHSWLGWLFPDTPGLFRVVMYPCQYNAS